MGSACLCDVLIVYLRCDGGCREETKPEALVQTYMYLAAIHLLRLWVAPGLRHLW